MNKLRTICPKYHESFKNSKTRVQFYWLLLKIECIHWTFCSVYHYHGISGDMTYCCSYFKKVFLLTRDGFLNHCPMKPLVICQPLRKFDMFTFVVSRIVCSILFFSVNEGNQSFGFLTGKRKGEIFQKGIETVWNYGIGVKRSK